MTRLGSAAFVDLDETLLFSCYFRTDRHDKGFDSADATSDKVFYDAARGTYDYRFGDIVGYHRPHAKTLLRFLHKHFDHLFVYTAGNEAYAQAMVDALFDDLAFRPRAIFDRNLCVEETENTAFMEYWHKYAKRLHALPLEQHARDVDLADSILIDDLASNARHNAKQAILMPKFAYDASFERDDWLLRLERYLKSAKRRAPRQQWSELDKSTWWF